MTTPPAKLQDNPLLRAEGLPRFHEIKPEHVEPAMEYLISEVNRRFDELEANLQPTWTGLIVPLDALDIPFEYAWGPVNHLLSVRNSDELRKVHERTLPKVVELGLRMRQSRPVYEGLKQLRASDAWNELDEGQQRTVELKIRSAEHAGVGLEGAAKTRFNQIEAELSKLSSDFSNHVLDATKAYERIVTDPAQTEGWPQSLKNLASQSYAQEKKAESTPDAGPWRITLDYPSLVPFMQHSRDRAAREEVYRASVTRAAGGELDNRQIILKTLQLRQEKAKLLGFSTYAELSLDSKMAPSVAEVDRMSEELLTAARRHAEQDFTEIEQLARQEGQSEPLLHWDVGFWAERLSEKRFDFTDEQLRPYFPLPRVLEGLFSLCTRLFGVSFEEVSNEPTVWHQDVRYYRVRDEAGEPIASFYLDPYSRPADKRGGAWMDECLSRKITPEGKLVLPVVHLCCNGTPPVGDKPSLMSFSEVETLFHEFGHGLQGMLTQVDYASVSGINGVEWDAVELASQFMENWCYERPVLLGMTAHYETGEPLPEDLFEKICQARTFRSGSQMLRQLELGMTDMELHHRYKVEENDEAPQQVQARIARRTSILPPLPEAESLCGFSHIFAGGYAAGYYSYKWAEVLSADAFAAFEEAGLSDDAAVQQLGRRYRDTVLALGGSRHPMQVFKDFRGREPSTEPLLRHTGLA